MTTEEVQLILEHIRTTGLTPKEVVKGWGHIGATICDAALQRRANYEKTVRPRIEALIEEWPDAKTLSGFKRRKESGDLSAVLNWNGPEKLAVIEDLTKVFEASGIESSQDLAEVVADDERRTEFRRALWKVKFVGQKTVDYIGILAGSSDYVAVDAHVMTFVENAGVSGYRNADKVRALIKAAAKAGGWSAGALDAAIWGYMSAASQ